LLFANDDLLGFRGRSRWPDGFSSGAVRSGVFFDVETDLGFELLEKGSNQNGA